jgi:hypothetical protein
MDDRAREVKRIGDAAFSKKEQINSLHQEIALNFFPERADFTNKRNEGEEFADHLFASYPVLARRELGNMLSEFLRPGKFLSIHVDDDELDEGDAERAYLEYLTDIQWRAMSDPRAHLVTATGQTDHDFAAFGNGVLKYGTNVAGDGLLFRNYHLRDCAWSENAEGTVDCLHRNWNPTARQLKHHFGDAVSENVKKACAKDPEKTFACRHVVMPSRLYEYKSRGGKSFAFTSLYIECESETILEQAGLNHFCYVIPRWQTVSGSAYGVSMATAILLPDGRTLQVVMRTTREAGESYVNPPMVAVSDAIRGDIALYPGGVTTADIEYDERLGEVLRPISQNRGGFPISFDIASALKEDIRSGFFLDKIQLPETTRAMTATEVRRRIQEHIRSAAPITKPIQQEYNHPLCDGVFQVLSEHGVFPLDQMPESLQGRDIKFKFRSPLDELAEQNEADIFVDVRDRILIPSAQLKPEVLETANLEEATRAAMRAAGWKQDWFNPKEAVEEARAIAEQKQQAEQAMQQVAMAGQAAQQAGAGVDAVVNAGAGAQPAQGQPAA